MTRPRSYNRWSIPFDGLKTTNKVHAQIYVSTANGKPSSSASIDVLANSLQLKGQGVTSLFQCVGKEMSENFKPIIQIVAKYFSSNIKFCSRLYFIIANITWAKLFYSQNKLW
jgi:hypothetical protein